MSSGTPSLTILSEEQKFNGENLLKWNVIIAQLLGSKGLTGYIDGTIPKPALPTTGSTTPDPTPIYSSKPNYDEWIFRDQLARGHITLNCTNVAGLGVTTTGTAKEAWESIQAEWGRSTDMRRSHAQEALNRTIYAEDSDIQEHIKLLRTRRAAVDNLSSSVMNDETWRGIVIRSIPPTTKWLPVIPSLYTMTTTADVFSTLIAHAMTLERIVGHKPTSGSSTSTALAAKTFDACTNPNCKAKKRSTHSTSNCYWPGGGKEGQFPPNFGQKTRANVVSSAQETTEHFVLSAQAPEGFGISGVVLEGNDEEGTTTGFVSKGFQGFAGGRTPTFIDSGASDTMFVSRGDFNNYKSVTPRSGDSAKAIDGDFEIIGEGTVVKQYLVDGKEKTLTYTRAIHTPTLNSNLLSVSAFDKAGLRTIFEGGRGVVQKKDGSVILSARLVKGMYVVDEVANSPSPSSVYLGVASLSQPATLEQWHRRLSHCSPLTIMEMSKSKLVDGLHISGSELRGKCEDCIIGRQTRRPYDGHTEKDLDPLELVSFDLWGPSCVQSAGGKVYFMPIVDGGSSYKHGAFLADKSDASTIPAFDAFRAEAEALSGRKIRRVRTDRAYDSAAWKEYCQRHSIIHEFSAPYSSAQNGLAERAIRTTMDDVRTLLRDSGLGHSYWAEAAAFSIHTRNLLPSRRHPGKIPLETFTGKRQDVSHLRVFGARCWAKIPTVHGSQVDGGSKLDPRGFECRLLGYAGGHGNYKVQGVESRRVFVSRDVVFEEGHPHRTSPSVGEDEITLFDVAIGTLDEDEPKINQPTNQPAIPRSHIESGDRRDTPAEPIQQTEPIQPDIRRSSRIVKPTLGILQSREYQQREEMGKQKGEEWAHAGITLTSLSHHQDDYIACLTETKASHNIPHSYRHAMATDPDRWTAPMEVEVETLKARHTWDLVKPPLGANIMDSMWVYDIKWDGEGNRIKDKARLVGKGYTQQLGVDYNETWAGVTRLESVRITAAIAAKLDLKLWRIDFVGAYLNSLTKEDIYMKQPEGFVEEGFEDHVCKLVHTIYGTMQGAHDWYETLTNTYDKLGYTTSRADPCVRFKKEGGGYTLTDTYTDDVFGASKTDEEIQRRKDEIGRVWEIKDVGKNEYFLGTRIQQDIEKGTIRLTQRPYWEHVLNRFNLTDVPLRNTPLPVGIVLDRNMSPKTESEKGEMSDKPYRPVLGSIMWGQLATRPDLSFTVSLLSRFQANPGIEHWKALLHVVGYVRNTIDYGLTYSRDADLTPLAYVDADYGGCRDTRRSTSGYVFTMAGGAVTWSSKRQATVALSTVEAEYVAMSRCAQQMVWMQTWLDEVDIAHKLPGIIKGDSRGAMALAKNTKDHGKVKHIDICHHYLRELVKSGSILYEQIPSADNVADLFTKPLSRDHHHRFLEVLNIF